MPSPAPDPVLVNARREAIIVLLLWAAATAWTCLYCMANAYGRTLDSLTYVLGFPDWVFYGLIVPWGVCTVFTLWFCTAYMTDDDWGEESDSEITSTESQEPADRG